LAGLWGAECDVCQTHIPNNIYDDSEIICSFLFTVTFLWLINHSFSSYYQKNGSRVHTHKYASYSSIIASADLTVMLLLIEQLLQWINQKV
jgi:hypothetical protein